MERCASSVTITSKVSIGIAGLYAIGSGDLNRFSKPAAETSSSSGASSRPRSIEYSRWMVQIVTRAVVSSVFEVRC